MKLSREWLGEYTTITASDKEYAEKMTMSGSKAEGVAKTGAGISNVVAGRVAELHRHENSDHLWVCAVDVGQGEPISIVTGAQNVRAGDMVPAALDGASLPGGVTIRSGELRGVLSCGMLCSLKELGLDTHDYPYAVEDGIFILREPCAPGENILDVLGLGDSVVEFEITNNRPDCLSVIGLARESAATFDTALRLPPLQAPSGDSGISDYLNVEIEEPALCPRYTARMVKNIKIEPSPPWMRRRLRASGVRPINNIVDITNYVMLEYGQPMHAFDYACVEGKTIKVRRARPGETLETLDGNIRKLTSDMLVIADESRPIGVAGVMGGGNSEITGATGVIVFESANFDGTSVRKTSIALGMRTDASSRFEKGLDPCGTVPAVERACELVRLLGAGEVLGGTIDVLAVSPAPRVMALEPEKINALLGTDISEAFMVETLKKLGFSVSGREVTVPSWRSDVSLMADLAEEAARFYGYGAIAPTPMRGGAAPGGYSAEQAGAREMETLCRSMGFSEIMTYSFGGTAAWDKLRLPEESPLRRALVIQNPLGEDSAVMRTSALPSMLETLALNLSRRNLTLRLYEPATVYLPRRGEALAEERGVLTLGACGAGEDFFALKGCVEALLRALRVKNPRFEPLRDNPSYHPGRCAEVFAENTRLGVLGQIHPEVCSNFGVETDLYAAELDAAALLRCRGPEPVYTPLPRYPAVTRDIAVVADRSIPAADIEAVIRAAGGRYLESCSLFDVYTGAAVPEGKRSLAFSLTLRAADQTLTDALADQTVAAILEDLKTQFGASIR